MTSRRQFLISCSSLTLAAGLAPASLFARSWRNISLDQIDFETFLTQQGAVFRVLPESAPAVKLKLVEVQKRQATCPGALAAEDAENEKFSLLFRGGDSPALRQDTYVFEHDDIGRFAMFIVPVRIGNDGRNYYQAIFNRPNPAI
jgi:Domain of unknown function (DUF6916)